MYLTGTKLSPCLQDAVAAGVSQAIQQLRSGAFSRQRIRQGALQQARSFRAALNAEVQAIFEEHGVRLSAADWFAEHFCHKRVCDAAGCLSLHSTHVTLYSLPPKREQQHSASC